ncbi:hypothetical protein RM96_22600 [Cupriavidus sp. IDO]|nr:hypothetical protein RM96_22600 [Cupriavidus sp. IDO]
MTRLPIARNQDSLKRPSSLVAGGDEPLQQTDIGAEPIEMKAGHAMTQVLPHRRVFRDGQTALPDVAQDRAILLRGLFRTRYHLRNEGRWRHALLVPRLPQLGIDFSQWLAGDLVDDAH